MELAKQFQNLSGLEAVHCAMIQATAHETINAGHMAHNAAFSTDTANQMDKDCKKSLCQLHTEADQAWKDTNDVIFSHQLRYDSQLVAFISTAEGTLQAKWDENWRCVHSLADDFGLANSGQTAHHSLGPLLPHSHLHDVAYCPEFYTFQTWSTTGDGDYFLDDNAWATSLLTWKLMCMAGGANLDECCPSRATFPAGSVGSAVLGSPGCSPSCSHSRTPANRKERSRSQSNSMSSLFSGEPARILHHLSLL